jgi:hypothetical protein
MPLYLNKTPIVKTRYPDAPWEVDIRKYGVKVLLVNGPKEPIGAPFGAVVWRSDDWFTPDGPLANNKRSKKGRPT